MNTSISICSNNVRGLGNKCKREQIFAWLRQNKYAICLLQETNSEGIGILINPSISYTIQNVQEIVTGRIQVLDIFINEKECTIINVHGPNNDEIRIFEKLEEYIKENEEKTIIIGEDFNTVLDENLDKRNGRTDTHRKCRSKIRNLMDTYNLIDIWRETHSNIK